MAFTFQQKFDDAKLDRSLAVNSKNALVTAREEVLEEDEFNDSFLHGDTNNIGINDLIWFWYAERRLEWGDTYYYPEIGDTYDDWTTNYSYIMTAALSPFGDSGFSEGFYPPDENGTASSTINFETIYLNHNGDSVSGDSFYRGFLGYLKLLTYSVGDTPGAYPWGSGDTLVSGYVYSDQAEAENAAEILIYGDSSVPGTQNDVGDTMTGTGLIGRRLANVEIAEDEDTGNWRYTIGADLTGDSANFWGDSLVDVNGFLGNIAFKTNFLTGLLNTCLLGDSVSDYQNHLRRLLDELERIEGLGGDTNIKFQDPDMAADVGDSSGTVGSILSLLGSYIGDSGDSWYSGGDTTLWGLYFYFNDGARTGSEGIFNNGLYKVKEFGDSLDLLISSRYNNLYVNIIGDTYDSSESDFTNARKWRNFWIKTRILKPKASLLSYNALGDAITNAEVQITNANTELITLLGDTLENHLEYIPTPNLFTVYHDPKRNQDTGVIRRRKVQVVYDGQQHATAYWIYRDDIPIIGASTISNDQWGDSLIYAKFTNTDPITGFVETTYTDWDATFANGDKYVYRVRTFDDVNTVNGDTTASLQSEIFDSDNGKSFASVTGDSTLMLGDSHNFRVGEYVVINGTDSRNGYYTITRIGDSTINVSPSMGGDTSGTAYPCTSAVFIEE
jgi:hypothetical protein